jgi:hypothetical protein
VFGRAVGCIVQDDDLKAGMPLGKSALYRTDNEFLAPMSRNDDGYVGRHHGNRDISGVVKKSRGDRQIASEARRKEPGLQPFSANGSAGLAS